MKEVIQVSTTVEKREDATRIARALTEKRLAACVQIIGLIRSTYWWKGKIEETDEWLCLLKTRKDLYEKLEKTLRAIHPYEVPEITAQPIVAGSRSYLQWIDEETTKRKVQGAGCRVHGKKASSKRPTTKTRKN
jgi:periplasmic divalent cation tolerance protein